MTSTDGWVRANLFYDNLSSPPAPGSPEESVCAYVFSLRQKSEFIKYKLIAQAGVTSENKDSLQELVESLHSALYPSVEKEKWNRDQKAKEMMEKYMNLGPISVTPS